MSRIFYTMPLYHATADKPVVYRLAVDLATRGFPVWFDAWNIKLGHSLKEAIDAGIDNSDYLLVAFSRHTAESSYWLPAEVDRAVALEQATGRKIVIPLRLDETTPPSQVGDRFYDVFSKSYSSALRSLISELRSLGAGEVDVPITRRALPLLIREGTYLQQAASVSCSILLALVCRAMRAYPWISFDSPR